MENLAYKTFVTEQPVGKFPVYFTCHPEDFSLYFTSVSDSIINALDCAVWYACENDTTWGEVKNLNKLCLAELIVIPVTHKFIYEDNPAKNLILPFVNTQSIPILPIIEEKGIDEKVQKLFGERPAFYAFDYDCSLDPYGKMVREAVSSAISYCGSYRQKSLGLKRKEGKEVFGWVKTYGGYCSKIYRDKGSKGNTNRYFLVMMNILDALSEGNAFLKITSIEKVLNEMDDICSNLSSEFSKNEKREKKVICIERRAKSLVDTGRFPEAQEIYKSVLNEARNLYDIKKDAASLFELCNIFQGLGRCSYSSKEGIKEISLQEQISYYKNALLISKKLFEITDYEPYRKKMCEIFEQLEDCLEEFSTENTLSFIEDERGILTDYCIRTGRVAALDDLNSCYERLGKLYEKLDKKKEAKAFYEKEINIADKAFDEDKDTGWLNIIEYIYLRLIQLAEEDDDLESISRYQRKSSEVQLQKSLIIGDSFYKGKDFADAYINYKDAVDIIEDFRKTDPEDNLISEKKALYQMEQRVHKRMESILHFLIWLKEQQEANAKWDPHFTDNENTVSNSKDADKEEVKKLNCRTKNNDDPKNKPKIYYTSHPDDFDHYLNDVFNDITDSHDCAIWYDPEFDRGWNADDLEMTVGNTQLIVIPVTSRFLNEENPARDVIVPLANKKHTPILPLLQEEVSEEDYARVFEDIQFLDKQSSINDNTEIPYEDKLNDYLSSILLDDSLIDEVKSAFIGTIFLSYRKKNRKYALKLMNLIHENDFCRDIAIWYDEFLIPGEKFNNAIKEALEKSNLFALVITPDLLEKDNYVQTQEYPYAVSLKKIIVPAEMLPTDRKELGANYIDLPDVIDVNDKEAFSSALYKDLEPIVSERNDNSPYHLYLIGLAYLNGIDVEKNGSYAVELITISADQHLPEAMKKLGQIYETGNGTKRDYNAALYWYKECVKYWKESYEKDPDENVHQYLSSLHDLGDIQSILGMQEDFKDTFFEVSSIYKTLGEKEDNDVIKIIADVAQIGTLMDEATISLDWDNLKVYAEKMLELLDRSKLDDLLPAVSCSARINAYYSLEGSYAALKEWSSAINWAKKGLEYLEKLGQKKDEYCRPSIHASLYYSIAKDYLSDENKDLFQAQKYCEQGLNIAESLDIEIDGNRECLADLYRLMGEIKEKINLEEARTWIEKGIKLEEEEWERVRTYRCLQSLCPLYNELVYIYKKEGDLENAKSYFEKEMKALKEVETDKNSLFYLDLLASAYMGMGIADEDNPDVESLRTAEKIYKYLMERYENASIYNENIEKMQNILTRKDEQS